MNRSLVQRLLASLWVALLAAAGAHDASAQDGKLIDATVLTLKNDDIRHPFRLVLFEGGDHGWSEHRAEVDRLAKDWLDRFVRDGRTWPSLEPHGP